jgi:hypothetical protein
MLAKGHGENGGARRNGISEKSAARLNSRSDAGASSRSPSASTVQPTWNGCRKLSTTRPECSCFPLRPKTAPLALRQAWLSRRKLYP